MKSQILSYMTTSTAKYDKLIFPLEETQKKPIQTAPIQTTPIQTAPTNPYINKNNIPFFKLFENEELNPLK